MKIGFDAKRIFHNTSGLGNYSRDIVRILNKYLPENDYFLYNPKPGKVSRLKIKGSIKERNPKSSFWKWFSSIWRQKAIINDLKKDGIDLYHGLSNEIPYGIEKTEIKTVVTIHDLIFIRFPHLYPYFDRKIHLKKFKHAVKKADLVIAISKQTKRDIIKFLDIHPEKIRIVYQGCHNAFKQNFSEKELKRVKTDYNLPNKFILNVGTIEERKNQLNVLKANKDLDTNIVFIGKASNYIKKLHNYIEQHKMQDRVQILEHVSMEDLAIVYRLATIFVYPSLFEGFGIPIIEALYSKTPVITSTQSSFAEAGGPASIYVDPKDTKKLKDEISNLITDENKRNDISKIGYEYVQQFNDEIVIEKLLNVYKELVP